MENTTNQSQPTQDHIPAPATTANPVQKKTSPWMWILGGCLTIIILGLIGSGIFIWWGYTTAKKAIQENAPSMEEFKGKMKELNAEAEKWSQEADRLEKESQKMRDSMPDQENDNSGKPMPY